MTRVRREQLFKMKEKAEDPNLIKGTIRQRIDAKTKVLTTLSDDEKALCALRKAFSQVSKEKGQRCYVIGKVYITSRNTTPRVKPTDQTTYHYTGRCKFATAAPVSLAPSYQMASFDLYFRDSKDSFGFIDVELLNDTTIDTLPKGSPLVPA